MLITRAHPHENTEAEHDRLGCTLYKRNPAVLGIPIIQERLPGMNSVETSQILTGAFQSLAKKQAISSV